MGGRVSSGLADYHLMTPTSSQPLPGCSLVLIKTRSFVSPSYYYEVEKMHGTDKLKIVADSQRKSIEFVKNTAKEVGVVSQNRQSLHALVHLVPSICSRPLFLTTGGHRLQVLGRQRLPRPAGVLGRGHAAAGAGGGAARGADGCGDGAARRRPERRRLRQGAQVWRVRMGFRCMTSVACSMAMNLHQ